MRNSRDRTIRTGLGKATAARRHPAPNTISRSFGFRPGIDFDKLGQLADQLEAEAFAEKVHDPAGRKRPRFTRTTLIPHCITAPGCGGTPVSRAPKVLAELSRRRNGLRAADDRQHPVPRTPRQSGFDRIALKVVNYWRRCDQRPSFQHTMSQIVKSH